MGKPVRPFRIYRKKPLDILSGWAHTVHMTPIQFHTGSRTVRQHSRRINYSAPYSQAIRLSRESYREMRTHGVPSHIARMVVVNLAIAFCSEMS